MLSPIVSVFVSSTWLDLRPEHEAVERALHALRETKYVGMKYFSSRDETTRQASLDEVDRSLAYVGIVAGRYGSGITEAEYDRARQNGLPCFIYFKDDATIADEGRDTEPDKLTKLDAFKLKLRANHSVGPDFKSPEDLAAKVTSDLHRWLFDKYLTPKLQDALRGELPREDAQTLLDAVKDLQSLKQDLLDSLRDAGFNVNVASGARSVAYTGDAGQVNINTGDTHVHNVAAPVIPTLHQLRAPVLDFVGREKEIEQLLATLRRGGSAAITGISGMGGIGKTELAYYVAERLRETYPDAQLVLDMRGTDDPPRDPSDALASCIRAFHGLEQRLPDDTAQLTDFYRSTLEGKRALILLDNAHDSAQVRPLLPPVGSALLITSRNVISLPGMQRTTLEQLEPSEARELLTGICPRVPADTADQICYLCGYLPLAIRAAGSLLDVTIDLDPSDYAAQLGDERTRLELLGTNVIDINVEASFKLSYDRLSPDAARVFRQLAVFPATFAAAAEESICEDPGHKHLSDLLRRNLVLYNPDTRRYRLHDLSRLFANSRLSEMEQFASRIRHSTHYLEVLKECQRLYVQGAEAIKSGLALFDIEWHNIETGQNWPCRQTGAGGETDTWLCNEYGDAGVDVLLLRQHPRERILWIEAALTASRQLKDRAAEQAHLGNLGVSYTRLGEMQRAIEFQEKALVMARKIGSRAAEGRASANLGRIYGGMGEAKRTIEYSQQALVIFREGGNKREEGNALSNLGNAYFMLGEMQRAINSYEQALAVFRELGDRLGESYVLGNLGSAYLWLGEASRAVDIYNEILIVAREMGDKHSEGTTLHAISLALDALGDRKRATEFAKGALKVYTQLESPSAAKVRSLLAKWRAEETEGE